MTKKALEPVAKPPRWEAAVLVCSECKKRTGSANAPKKLSKWLRSRMKRDRRRDLRVLRTGCLDVCPKQGVTVSITGHETFVVENTDQWEALANRLPAREG